MLAVTEIVIHFSVFVKLVYAREKRAREIINIYSEIFFFATFFFERYFALVSVISCMSSPLQSASSAHSRLPKRARLDCEQGTRGWSLPPSEENLMNERVPHSLLTVENSRNEQHGVPRCSRNTQWPIAQYRHATIRLWCIILDRATIVRWILSTEWLQFCAMRDNVYRHTDTQSVKINYTLALHHFNFFSSDRCDMLR